MSSTKLVKRRDVIVALGSTGMLMAVGCSSSSSKGDASSSSGGSTGATGGAAGAGGSGGAAGAGSTADAGSAFDGAATCVLTPAVTEGPYYIDGSMLRKDLREGHPGAQLTLRMRVVDVKNCEPIPNAVFDIWNCDAGGKYSGYESGVSAGQMGGGGPNGAPDGGQLGDAGAVGDGGMPALSDGGNLHVTPTDDTRYLRGTQVADSSGVVEFITIYPGWYDIRTHHVHFKIFVSTTELITGQIYFPQSLNDEISLTEPYASHSGTRTKNTTDALIHSDNDSAGTWPTMTTEGSANVATVTIAVQR
jgi:protocatechuate 3,4-dioxygenase beta subunit